MLTWTSSVKPPLTIAFVVCLSVVCESVAAQSDANRKPAGSPFEQWDTNSDGYLSQDEFPNRGKRISGSKFT